MPKLKVSLSIGYPTATHEDVIDIDDNDYEDCETQEERDNLIREYWVEWSNNYIVGDMDIISDT